MAARKLPNKHRKGMSHKAFAALDFEPQPDYDVTKPEFRERHDEALQNFMTALRLAIGLLGRTKTEIIEGARKHEDSQFDGGAWALVERIKQARQRCHDYAIILGTAEERLLVALHNVYAPNGVRLDRPQQEAATALRGEAQREADSSE
jgi:hypothetical protein